MNDPGQRDLDDQRDQRETTEQRASPRRELELPASVHDHHNRVKGAIRFDTRDISLGGAFLRSDLLFEVGEELSVEFQIPGGPLVCVRGKVIHVARATGPAATVEAGMGIAFSEMSEHDRDAVRAFILRG